MQFSFAQDYIPMLEEGNVWNVIGLDGFGGPPTNVTREVTGEETINGVVYKIVNNVDCRYREENGKVYAYWQIDDTEYLMYDFTLEVGDIFDFLAIQFTWCKYILDAYIPEMTVSSRTTQFIAGEDRIVLELEENGTYVESWIEGIGSTTGFFPNGNGFDSASRLTCFTKDGNTYLFNGYTECVILGLEDQFKERIILVPNPVTHTSVLKFPSEATVDRVKIYDLNGRLITNEGINKNNYTINAMNYRSGLYFYQVFSEEKLLKTEKFIVK